MTVKARPPHRLVVKRKPINETNVLYRRFGFYEKGAVLPPTQQKALPRVKISDLPPNHIPLRWVERLEHDQLLRSCCRHPENMEIEGFKSHPEELMPDVFKMYCRCGRTHHFFFVGEEGETPRWSVV